MCGAIEQSRTSGIGSPEQFLVFARRDCCHFLDTMSRLFGVTRAGSELLRRNMTAATRAMSDAIDGNPPNPGLIRRAWINFSNLFGNQRPQSSQPPGPSVPSISGAPPRNPSVSGELIAPEEYDQIELLGRDASYDENDWMAIRSQLTRVSSSNVYGYAFEAEARTTGILYVTFLYDHGHGKRGPGPGATYAYYGVPVRTYHRFQAECQRSPGSAVWDQLRIRGTLWGHQFTYRLIHAEGEYIPRKAVRPSSRPLKPGETPFFRERHLPNLGTGRRGFRRSTLTDMTASGPDSPEGLS